MMPKVDKPRSAAARSTAAQSLTEAVLEIFRANGRLIEWGDRLVAPLGLTSARWQMLGAIALSQSPLTAPQLAEAMGVTRQGAQKQLNLLLADGMVRQEPNPSHLRSPLYELTEKGRDLYGKAERMWLRHAERLSAGLSVAEIELARGILARVRGRLELDRKGVSP